MSRRALRPVLTAALLCGALAACGEHKFEPPSQEERVAEADSLYSPAMFDSVSWASDQERIEAGNLVFADECRRCHGPLGRAGTEYDERNDLEVPSLVEPDWPYADDIEGVRRRIFTGHVGGMPTWGVAHLSPRQIDAAAYYLIEELRPEVLSDTSVSIPSGS